MRIDIPAGQVAKYKQIEEEAEKAEFMAIVEKLPRDKQLKLLWFARWIRLRGMIKSLLGLHE